MRDCDCELSSHGPGSRRTLELALASVGGIGFVPRGAATLGTAIGACTFFMLRPRLAHRLALVAAATVLGQVCSVRLRSDKGPDPQYVIIDEVAGVWLALIATPVEGPSWLLATVLFRVLDKLKPGPIGLIDRRGGAWSVMGDDLLAGLLAGLIINAGARIGDSFH